eukprot:6484277-Amphidinium_carterae.1
MRQKPRAALKQTKVRCVLRSAALPSSEHCGQPIPLTCLQQQGPHDKTPKLTESLPLRLQMHRGRINPTTYSKNVSNNAKIVSIAVRR